MLDLAFPSMTPNETHLATVHLDSGTDRYAQTIQMFLREQALTEALTEAFHELNGMRVVCVDCYARLKKLHSAQD